jgi:radical SAM superfamily enzyme YgiQ (UPF0313 family)
VPSSSQQSGGDTTHSDLSSVLIFPNSKDVALASLGFLKVHHMLAGRLACADISYLPAGEGDGILSPKQGLLLGHNTGSEVSRFDLIAFSISYENDFVHVVELLRMAGVSPLGRDRPDTFPVVCAGGFTMTSNPLPLADFLDFAVVGEAEGVIDRVISVLEDARRQGTGKADLLARLGEITGVYVPSLEQRPVNRVWVDGDRMAAEPPAEAGSHFGEVFLVEVGRGCGRGCSFCAAGALYRPVRMRSAADVISRCAGSRKVGLVGTAVSDHPDILTIMEALVRDGKEIGISSLRADQVTAESAELLVRGGVRTVAIAPEAGSEALRAKIGKPITDEQVMDAVRNLGQAGIQIIKLYFMIGLPGETDADVEAAVALVENLTSARARARLSVAAAPFVPKPHTPFQWCGFAERATLRRRAKILRRISRLRGCSLKVGSIDEAWVEAVLARGDRALSPALLEAAEQGSPLKTVLRRRAPAHRTLDTRKPLPWDFIDSGVPKKRLLEQYDRSGCR